MRCWLVLPLLLAGLPIAAACSEPTVDPDGGRPDAFTPPLPDAGPPVDHSRPGLVPILEACAIPAVPDPSAIQLEEDIEYARVGAESLRLDVAWPLDGADHPLVVMIHGGAWMVGDKADERPRDFIVRLASIGYAAASINYRLATPAGDNLFPAAVEDARCAVRWLRANADRWSADRSRTVVAGASAGAHLALMVGLAADAGGFDGSCALTDPIDVVGIVSDYGAMDLRASAFGDPIGAALVSGFLGDTPDAVPDLAESASPILYIDPDDVPPLLVHGTEDGLVPVEQSRAMQAALEAAGVASTYVEVPLAPHAFALLTEEERYRVSSCTTLAYLEAVTATP